MLEPVDRRKPGIAVGKARRLGDEGHDILAKTVHTHIQPEAHDVLELLAHARIVHIEIRLFSGEEMQIVFVQPLIIFPCAALKMTGPVVGREPASGHGASWPPVVIVVIGIVPALPTLPKPGMFVRAVVHHEVEEHPHAAFVRLLQQFPEHLEVAEVRMDVPVIGDVVAVVGIRGRVDRREPDRVCAKALDIVELLQNAPQVPNPVAVSVTETARPDVIDAHLFVPLAVCHRRAPPVESVFRYCTTAFPLCHPLRWGKGFLSSLKIVPFLPQLLTKR